MIAVIFEAEIAEGQKDNYLDAAAQLKPLLAHVDGFISIERFQSLSQPDKLLSLSFWRDEEAVQQWRNMELHRIVQAQGRDRVFSHYRLRVAGVLRDYDKEQRQQAPDDSRAAHG